MKNLSIRNIVSACGGEYHGSPELLDREISAVTTDSRAVTKDCMFAAIVGERTDGHRYIASAFAGGALCVLAKKWPEETDGAVIIVPSTVTALQKIAAFYRQGFDIPVIGVTGSVGKTTAKEMVASVLGQKYCVHKTAGNFNNELGVPLTLFGLDERHTAAVIEMGISHFGEMKRLGEMVRPDYALYTVIGHAHLEFLGDRAGVLKAKTEMLEYLPPDGKVFINGDDDMLVKIDCPQTIVRYGIGDGCAVRAENISVDGSGNTACDIVSGERRIEAKITSFGDHMIYAALEAAAVGMELGLSDEEIAAGITAYQPVGHRGRVINTGKITVIDDCYNANPTSVSSAIRSMMKLPGRKVCILGDMFELGSEQEKLHADIGRLASENGAELILTCGALSKNTHDAATVPAVHFEDREELISNLSRYIRTGDTVLVKASHSMKFEEVAEKLLEC